MLAVSVYWFSFLSFGLYVALQAQKKKLFPKEFLYIASLAFSLLFTYFIFYVYAFRYGLGHHLLLAFCAVGFLFFALTVREAIKNKQTRDSIRKFYAVPLFITLAFLVFYAHFLYACPGKAPVTDQWGEIQNPAFCHIAQLPIDNALPFIYAEDVLSNHAKELVIDWSIADRPPLQIGASLPIADVTLHASQFTKYAYYTVFAIFLQLSWIGVLWGILNTLFKQRWRVWGLLIGFGGTGFFYLNSVFVWPKLLSASLVVFSVFLLIDAGKTKRLFDYRYAVMAALAISLGLLAHTGVVFTLLGMLPVMAYDLGFHRKGRKLPLKPLVAAVILSLLLLVPWQITKSHLTTHDRLVKWQLAGVISAKDQRGTLETIKQEYQKLTFKQWLSNKKSNTEVVFTGSVHNHCDVRPSDILSNCNLASWRSLTFFSPFFAFEFFILGFPAALWQMFKRTLDKLDRTLLWTSLLSLVAWILLLFIPGSTVLHQGSYATEILLFIVLGRKLASLPSYVFGPLIGLQVILFYIAWLRPFGIHVL